MNKRTATIILKELLDCIPTERKEEYENAIHSLLKPQWIDVDESLPYEYEDLVYTCGKGIFKTKYVVIDTKYSGTEIDYMLKTDKGSWDWSRCYGVERWMPLPQ